MIPVPLILWEALPLWLKTWYFPIPVTKHSPASKPTYAHFSD